MLYYAMIDGQRLGPMDLSSLVEAGVGPETYVWCKGMKDWTQAAEVADICRFWRQRLAGTIPASVDITPDTSLKIKPEDSPEDGLHPAIGRRTVLGPENDRVINPDPDSMLRHPPGGVVWAIVVTLLCFPPTGFMAIYFFRLSAVEWTQSGKAKGEEARRLRQAAWDHSRQGRMWTGITFFLGLIIWALMARFNI